MSERPILFSAPMVRALLAGTKTQTRRVVKPLTADRLTHCPGFLESLEGVPLSRYGQPGDRLWVRETFAHVYAGNGTPESRRPGDVAYRADGHGIDAYAFGRWCPSIHMPRWASRITLEITGVRVERLQAISEEDARAEGVERIDASGCGMRLREPHWRAYGNEETQCANTAVANFRSLWEQINGAESWDVNPWVWIVEFKRAAAALGGATGGTGEAKSHE